MLEHNTSPSQRLPWDQRLSQANLRYYSGKSSWASFLHATISYHKPKYQTDEFRDIQETGSGQVKHQELGESIPSTRWGGSPTGKRNLLDKIFFITTAYWMFESFNEISNQSSLVKIKFHWSFVYLRSQLASWTCFPSGHLKTLKIQNECKFFIEITWSLGRLSVWR